MHDIAKEGYNFWFLMPDVGFVESRIAADLIRQGLTANETIDVLEKRRDGYDFKSTLGPVFEQA